MGSIHTMRIKLPTGRESSIVDGLKFCYDLSETDILILLQLLKGGGYTVDDLVRVLGLSKATINRGLAKLVELGFATRVREKRSKVGRPRYWYTLVNPEQIVERVLGDFYECARVFGDNLQKLLREARETAKEAGGIGE